MSHTSDGTTGTGTGAAAPRIAPLGRDEWDARTRELLAGAVHDVGDRVPDVFTTLVRHPDLYEQFVPFGAQLLRHGRLPDRTRELLVLRTALNTSTAYEWARHVPIARAVGVADADIERLSHGPGAEGWSATDAALLRAADELHRDARISGPTWDRLAKHFGEAELIEITMLVGQYHMVAFFLNSAGVVADPGFTERLPQP